MVQILPRDSFGNFDNDSVDIYQALNLPVQDSLLGPGKSFKTENQDLNFSCAIRQGNYECSIVFVKSPNVVFDRRNQLVKYEVRGPAAEELKKVFFLKDREYHFRSSDNLFSIYATDSKFMILFAGNGLP